jgi:hypothetical protein
MSRLFLQKTVILILLIHFRGGEREFWISFINVKKMAKQQNSEFNNLKMLHMEIGIFYKELQRGFLTI